MSSCFLPWLQESSSALHPLSKVQTALAAALKANNESSPTRKRRMRDLLIAAQVAVSLVLMIAGSLLIHSSIRALRMETGYDDKHVVDLGACAPEITCVHPKTPKRRGLQSLLTRVAARVPESRQSPTAAPPMVVEPAPHSSPPTASIPAAQHPIQPLLHLCRVELFRDAGHSPPLRPCFHPNPACQPTVIMSQSAAKQIWPDQHPIGRSLRLGTNSISSTSKVI